jgi:biopolymer transport protein ExbB/TolQ
MGTIYGLIIAFASVGSAGIPEAEKSKFLAKGISAAMQTTILGLATAIPLTVVYTIIVAQTAKIIDELDEHLVKLINLMTGNR